MGYCFFSYPTESERSKGNSKLGCGQIGIKMTGYRHGIFGSDIPFVHQLLKSGLADFNK